MTEYSHPLFSNGRYRVAALTLEEEYDPERVFAYAVMNSAGARLRHELTLDHAKAWVATLIKEDDCATLGPPVRTRSHRVRR